jgi:hypothetical protein
MHQDRPPFFDQSGPHNPNYRRGTAPPSKYEKIAAMRRESKASMLQKQVFGVELNEQLADPASLEARDAALGAVPPNPAMSFDTRPAAPQSLFYDGLDCGEAEVAPNLGNIEAITGKNAAELAKEMEALMDKHGEASDGKEVFQSSYGGTFTLDHAETSNRHI